LDSLSSSRCGGGAIWEGDSCGGDIWEKTPVVVIFGTEGSCRGDIWREWFDLIPTCAPGTTERGLFSFVWIFLFFFSSEICRCRWIAMLFLFFSLFLFWSWMYQPVPDTRVQMRGNIVVGGMDICGWCCCQRFIFVLFEVLWLWFGW
jgi:hypothetical protein